MKFAHADTNDQTNALIAEHVFGWQWYKLIHKDVNVDVKIILPCSEGVVRLVSDEKHEMDLSPDWNRYLPKYSSCLSSAWAAVNKVREFDEGIAQYIRWMTFEHRPEFFEFTEKQAAAFLCCSVLRFLKIRNRPHFNF